MIPAIGIGAALDFMRGKWWILPVAVLAVLLVLAKGDARHWEKQALACERRIEIAKREAAEQLAANERRVSDATADYAARTAAAEPIIIRSRDIVREYAQTEAGAAQCLDAARVDGVRRDREGLFAGSDPAATEGGSGAVQTRPAP
ncbi:MAG: hypothetical protein EON59_03225 [Alphaproteobacteria bacterium]|nr:MAG: hypothetical protein EON59_03225 [Alphaproteobacteria bacterium]